MKNPVPCLRLTNRGWLKACLIMGLTAVYVGNGTPAYAKLQLPPSGHGTGSIPFTFDPLSLPLVVVQVRINEQDALPFIVSPALNVPLWLTPEAAEKLDVKPRAARQGDTNVIASVSSVQFVGKEPRQDVKFQADIATLIKDLPYSMPMVHGVRIAGYIGNPVLRLTTTWVDFNNRIMTLVTAEHPALKIPGACVLPMTLRSGSYYVTVGLKGGGSTDLIADLSASTIVPNDFETYLKPKSAVKYVVSREHDVYYQDRVLISSLELGNYEEPDVDVMVADPFQLPFLGQNLLSRYLVTLDFRNGQMLLQRAADYAQRLRMRGSVGIIFEPHDSEWYISDVTDLSLAQKISKGDRLLQVDNIDVNGLPPMALDSLVSGFAHTRALLTLDRGGKRANVTVERANLFNQGDPTYGVVLKFVPGRLEVVTVAEGSVGRKAGLRAGDTIAELNGHQPELTGAIRIELAQPEVKLLVRHAGETIPHEIVLKDILVMPVSGKTTRP